MADGGAVGRRACDATGEALALRYFALDGTDHATHQEQSRMICRYIAWRNRNAHDRELGWVVKRANVA